jgi:hypothetical protein
LQNVVHVKEKEKLKSMFDNLLSQNIAFEQFRGKLKFESQIQFLVKLKIELNDVGKHYGANP